MPAAIVALRPAVLVASRCKRERFCRGELDAGPTLDFSAEGVEAAVLDGVFESRVLAVLAVAPIALDGDDGFRHFYGIASGAKTHHVCCARIRILLAMGHAHATADRDVPADYIAGIVRDSDVAEIMRKYVDVVRWRHRHHHLEFARQIGLAVD